MTVGTLRTVLIAGFLFGGLTGCSVQQVHGFLRDICLQMPNCFYHDEDGVTRRGAAPPI